MSKLYGDMSKTERRVALKEALRLFQLELDVTAPALAKFLDKDCQEAQDDEMPTTHEIEEQDFHFSERLWDAGEGVCCAAFQLGACVHTESVEYEIAEIEATPWVALPAAPISEDEEPF